MSIPQEWNIGTPNTCLKYCYCSRPRWEKKVLFCPYEGCSSTFLETGNLKIHVRSSIHVTLPFTFRKIGETFRVPMRDVLRVFSLSLTWKLTYWLTKGRKSLNALIALLLLRETADYKTTSKRNIRRLHSLATSARRSSTPRIPSPAIKRIVLLLWS